MCGVQGKPESWLGVSVVNQSLCGLFGVSVNQSSWCGGCDPCKPRVLCGVVVQCKPEFLVWCVSVNQSSLCGGVSVLNQVACVCVVCQVNQSLLCVVCMCKPEFLVWCVR